MIATDVTATFMAPFKLNFFVALMLDKKMILLSSGELRKFQLTKTLLAAPRVLMMDNPFIGLDASTRELLFNLLEKLTQVVSRKNSVP